MRILFLIRSMGRGGAERQLSLLARALKDRGCDVSVAVFYAGQPMEKELKGAGVEILDLGKSGRWDNLSIAIRFINEIRARRPHVVYSFMATQNVFALLLRPFLYRKDVRLVCGIRTALPSAWAYSKVAGLVDGLQRLLLPMADAVISNSRAGLDAWASGVREERKAVVENAVEVRRFSFCASQRLSQRASWGARDDQVLIGLVGRIDEKKNHALLLDALAELRKGRPELIAVFVGDGEAALIERLKGRAGELGLMDSIIWTGPSDDVARVYSALDVTCLPSVVEGFPNVLAEAMAVGVPCVATDVGDCRALLGDLGWIVPSGDASALATALLAAADASATWDRELSRRYVSENFSVEAMARKTLDVFSGLHR